MRSQRPPRHRPHLVLGVLVAIATWLPAGPTAAQAQAAAGTVAAADERLGGCSAPWGGRPFGFDAACARHDDGYDALRAAARDGRPLPAQERREVDRRFGSDLDARCAEIATAPPSWTACRGLALLYVRVVRFNSWRQHDGPPAPEPVGGWVAGLAAAALAGAAVSILGRRR